jgi:hypothetical protein
LAKYAKIDIQLKKFRIHRHCYAQHDQRGKALHTINTHLHNQSSIPSACDLATVRKWCDFKDETKLASMSELLWHHGKISKAEAVRRFRQFHPDGSFLMRNSETVMNAFVLSVG